MSALSTPSQDSVYDVFISCPHPDIAWATRLAHDLTAGGIRCFVLESNVAAGKLWEEKPIVRSTRVAPWP